jgi:hypothetical protein
MNYMIRNRTELRAAIGILEVEVEEQKRLLSGQVNVVYESFKPVNIARDLVTEVVTSEDFRNNLLTATVGITTGYIAKRLFAGRKSSFIKKLSGNFLQYAVANLIINPSRIIKSVILPILDLFTGEKESGKGNK